MSSENVWVNDEGNTLRRRTSTAVNLKYESNEKAHYPLQSKDQFKTGSSRETVPWLLILSCTLDSCATALTIPILSAWMCDVGVNSALHQGWISSAAALCTCCTLPWLGKLSDRFGRVNMMTISAMATGLGFCVAATARSVPVAVASRVLPSLLKCHFACAQAFVSDNSNISIAAGAGDSNTSDSKSRSRSSRRSNMNMAYREQAMSFLGISFGIAFIIGPLLGGLITLRFGLRGPLFAAAMACLFNCMVLKFVGEPSSKWNARQSSTLTLRYILRSCVSTGCVRSGEKYSKRGAMVILGLWNTRASNSAAHHQRDESCKSVYIDKRDTCQSGSQQQRMQTIEQDRLVEGKNGTSVMRYPEQKRDRELRQLDVEQHVAAMQVLLHTKFAFSLARSCYEGLFTRQAEDTLCAFAQRQQGNASPLKSGGSFELWRILSYFNGNGSEWSSAAAHSDSSRGSHIAALLTYTGIVGVISNATFHHFRGALSSSWLNRPSQFMQGDIDKQQEQPHHDGGGRRELQRTKLHGRTSVQWVVKKLVLVSMVYSLSLLEWGRAISPNRFLLSLGVLSVASNAHHSLVGSTFAAEAAQVAPDSVGELIGFSTSLDTVARVLAGPIGGAIFEHGGSSGRSLLLQRGGEGTGGLSVLKGERITDRGETGGAALGAAAAFAALYAAVPLVLFLYSKTSSGRVQQQKKKRGFCIGTS